MIEQEPTMPDANLDLIRQTFNVTEQVYDTEPVDSQAILPTPGFFRRVSNRPPKGSLSLFEDEVSSRTEYDH